MITLQQKLIENRNMIRREKFLSTVDPEFSEFLARAEFSSEATCIKNAAFPRWDEGAQVMTTSRGKVKYWNNLSFRTWEELVAVLNKFSKVKKYIGWFFTEPDGPYYRMSLNAFFTYIPNITDYGRQNEHYDFGWVGEADDVGVLVGKNSVGSTGKMFNISVWGL